MLTIGPQEFARACEALMIAATSAKDQNGLKVMADTPRRHSGSPDTFSPNKRLGTADSDVNPIRDTVDWQRVRAITLGAIVVLVNGAAVPGDEVHFAGFGAPAD
jgi:hypothetical protein